MKYIANLNVEIIIEAENIIQAKKKALACDGEIENISLLSRVMPEELIYSLEKEDRACEPSRNN